jgi:hypothetical protein
MSGVDVVAIAGTAGAVVGVLVRLGFRIALARMILGFSRTARTAHAARFARGARHL